MSDETTQNPGQPDIGAIVKTAVEAALTQALPAAIQAIQGQRAPQQPQQPQRPRFDLGVDDDDPYAPQFKRMAGLFEQQAMENARLKAELDQAREAQNSLGGYYFGNEIRNQVAAAMERHKVPEAFRGRLLKDIVAKVQADPQNTAPEVEVKEFIDLIAQHNQAERQVWQQEATSPRPASLGGKPVDLETLEPETIDEANDMLADLYKQINNGAYIDGLDAEA